MSTLLNHRGYTGTIEVDLTENCLHGSVQFVNDLISYQGSTIDELRAAFESAVEDYLETCAEIGKSPDKPCSGSFNVRIDPTLHRDLSIRAMEEGVSLNAVTAKAICSYLEKQNFKQEVKKEVMHVIRGAYYLDADLTRLEYSVTNSRNESAYLPH